MYSLWIKGLNANLKLSLREGMLPSFDDLRLMGKIGMFLNIDNTRYYKWSHVTENPCCAVEQQRK